MKSAVSLWRQMRKYQSLSSLGLEMDEAFSLSSVRESAICVDACMRNKCFLKVV